MHRGDGCQYLRRIKMKTILIDYEGEKIIIERNVNIVETIGVLDAAVLLLRTELLKKWGEIK